jgi:hypothetical protein
MPSQPNMAIYIQASSSFVQLTLKSYCLCLEVTKTAARRAKPCSRPLAKLRDVAEAGQAPEAGLAERVGPAGELRPRGRPRGRGRRRRRRAQARGRLRADGEAAGAPPAGDVHGRRLQGPGDDLGGHWKLQVRCVGHGGGARLRSWYVRACVPPVHGGGSRARYVRCREAVVVVS